MYHNCVASGAPPPTCLAVETFLPEKLKFYSSPWVGDPGATIFPLSPGAAPWAVMDQSWEGWGDVHLVCIGFALSLVTFLLSL